MRWKLPLLALALAGAGLSLVEAAAPGRVARSAREAARSQATDDASRVAAKVDEIIAAAQARADVRPAPLANDATFLRRVSLDVAGKIPVVNDARRFLADRSPHKRAAALERLLESPGYVNFFTTKWLELLVPEAQADFQSRYLSLGMHSWLRKQFAANVPYDKMARELLTMPMGNRNVNMNPYDNSGPVSPMNFYLAKKAKPEELAASVARLFLGVRLECAQCHDHPFGKWKREEFWSQAAFFAGLKGRSQGDFFFGPLTEVSDRRELTIPNTDRVAQARFLDGKMPRWKFKVSARTSLAEWMTAKDNPFFSRAIANRMWAHFFGVGLVEPIDDLVDDNLPSHPEVLDLLAREFAAHDFDLKFLIRTIVLTQAYQRSSVTDPASPSDPRLHARMAVKGLTAEQLYDSLCVAAGIRDNMPFQQRIYQFGTTRQQFQDRFTDQEKKTEYHTSIPQALTMMNNQVIIDATHPDRGEVLGAIVAAPFMKNAGKIEALFLASLARKPTPDELSKFLGYVEKGGAVKNEKKALADLFWALLNSTEFKFNH
jgi:hypothetical protein